MKKSGLIIGAIGLAITIFAGVSFITREKIVEIGSMSMMADRSHTMNWSPYLGIGIIVIGLIIYLIGTSSK
jgi:divalent metal cation (Fe/Co/Zn/Cd) transporter